MNGLIKSIKLTHIIKPTGVIHIEHKKISLVGQKLFNVLLAKALPYIDKQSIYQITTQELLEYLPSMTNVDHIRETLKEMCIPIEFNLFNKDKSKTWGFFALLPHGEIKKGGNICEYSFTAKMIELISDKKNLMYARLNLLIQQKYKGNKYGWFLYELCFDYKDVPEGGKTAKMTIQDIRRYFGIEIKKYPEFKGLNQHVLNPALKAVNQLSTLKVTAKLYKTGRKITHIQYFIKHKPQIKPLLEAVDPDDIPLNQQLFETLQNIEIADPAIQQLMSKWSEEQLQQAIRVYMVEDRKGGVKYPQSFIEKSLKNAWRNKGEITAEKALKKEKILEKAEEEKAGKEEEIYKKATTAERLNILFTATAESADVWIKVYDNFTENQKETFKIEMEKYRTLKEAKTGLKNEIGKIFDKEEEEKQKYE